MKDIKDWARCLPPRIVAAAFRMLFNRLFTKRRFQESSSQCVFSCGLGCALGEEDAIEHYSHCFEVLEGLLSLGLIGAYENLFVAWVDGLFVPAGVLAGVNPAVIFPLICYAVFSAHDVAQNEIRSHRTPTAGFLFLSSHCTESVHIVLLL